MPFVPHAPASAAEDHAAQIVALDAGDLAGEDHSRAETLAAACPGCAALLADLVAIRGAMTALPAPVRHRDYRLTEDDAARLRPAGWRRLAGWLAAPGSSVRPLATGLATLGIAGLLLTAGLPLFGASTASLEVGAAPDASMAAAALDVERQATSRVSGPAGLPAPGATEMPVPGGAGVASPGASPGHLTTSGGSDDGTTTGSSGAEPGSTPWYAAQNPGADKASPGDEGIAAERSPGEPTRSPDVPLAAIASLILLAAGVGLLVARAVARHRTA